jgi:general secretion pathway protein G
MKFRSRAGKPVAKTLKIQGRVDLAAKFSGEGCTTVCGRGFTLIEMVVVISMILILLSIALPMYNQSIIRAKEGKLHQNLTTLNKVIQEYSLDKKKAPQSLDDLVPGYLKFIPDDVTGRSDTWVTETEDTENAWDPAQAGIAGVHSGSNELSSDGTAYSTWTH